MICRSQRVLLVRFLQRVARVYYFRVFFDLALICFCNNSHVRLLSQRIILTHAFSVDQNDYLLAQCLCSLRAGIVASLPFKASANVIAVLSELEGCQDSKKSDLVLKDIGADVILNSV